MNFIWAFLECLIGLVWAGCIGWVFVTLKLSDLGSKVGLDYPLWKAFVMGIFVLAVLAVGIFMVVDAIKRGNK